MGVTFHVFVELWVAYWLIGIGLFVSRAAKHHTLKNLVVDVFFWPIVIGYLLGLFCQKQGREGGV